MEFFSSPKNNIVISEDEVDVALSVLNFNYKLFIGKHVADNAISNIAPVVESAPRFDEEMLDVSPFLGIVISHILKDLIHEANILQEIIVTSTERKNVSERLIKILTPKLLEITHLNLVFPILKKKQLM